MAGISARLAALVVVCASAVVVGIALLGQGGDRPPKSPAALEEPGATPTRGPAPTEDLAPEWTPERAPERRPEWTPAWRPERTPAQGPPGRSLPTGGTPLPDFAGALPGDDGSGPLPLGEINESPNADRLDFLFDLGDYLDAHWLDPQNPQLGSGVWTAGRPFHVREGFVNNERAPLPSGFDVVLYVTRLEGGPDERTYRYTSDYVLRGRSDRCGPNYETQEGLETCEWFVHDFPEGLPEGRFAIWAAWEAPCRAWIDLGLADACQDPDEVISLFSSGFDAPYSRTGPEYTATSR